MAGNNSGVVRWFVLIGIASAIVVFLLVILLPISFSYLDYYHYGLVRRRTSGRVNLDQVYEGGRYLLGPDHK